MAHQIPCLNSLAADRAYFAQDAGDAHEAFCNSDAFDGAARDYAEAHGIEFDDPAEFDQWAADSADLIAEWEALS